MATAAGHQRSPASATGLHRGSGGASSGDAHDSQAALDHTRAIAVVGRLLGVQSSLLAVQRQAFLVLARGSLDAQVTTRALFLPLIDEVSTAVNCCFASVASACASHPLYCKLCG
jgi:hypothetical protein